MSRQVRLLYPNDWLKNVGYTLNSKPYFNWFLCGDRYLDENGWYVLRVSPYSQFYCEKTGETLTPKGLYSRVESKKVHPIEPKLIILNDEDNLQRLQNVKNVVDYISQLRYHGVVWTHECQNNVTEKSPVCYYATFIFVPGVLIEKTYLPVCEIVKFAKKYNSEIRKVTRFPDCQQIDSLIEKYSCAEVSKKLFRLMKPYITSV